MAENELKPCPFCTEPGYLVGLSKCFVACGNPKCEAEGPVKVMPEDAIAAWNRRTPPSTAGWLPISTAPKDGTKVILWVKWRDAPTWNVGWWTGRGWTVRKSDGDLVDTKADVTHWQPCPIAPSQEGASEGEGSPANRGPV